MPLFLTILAANAIAQEGPAHKVQPAQCKFTLDQIADQFGPSKYVRRDKEVMHLSAVDTSVNGCPVLTDAGSGSTFDPPAPENRNATISPAR